MDDILIKTFVLVGSCVVLVLLWPGTRASRTTAEIPSSTPDPQCARLRCWFWDDDGHPSLHRARLQAAFLREGRRVACRRGHSFDVARHGYLNLLQPQDRRARRPGDAAEVLAARRRFLGSGAAAPLIEAVVDLSAVGARDAVLEVGCGEGQHLARIAHRFGCDAHGVDISVAAIDAAARRRPRLRWVVANADRFLPYADASFRMVLSITSRMNAPEFRRVLRSDGTLLVAIPAPDDLVELRRAALGEGVLRDRVERIRRRPSSRASSSRSTCASGTSHAWTRRRSPT